MDCLAIALVIVVSGLALGFVVLGVIASLLMELHLRLTLPKRRRELEEILRTPADAPPMDRASREILERQLLHAKAWREKHPDIARDLWPNDPPLPACDPDDRL